MFSTTERLAFGVLGVFIVVIMVFLIYILGYAVGLWHTTCQLDNSQPQCIAQGWGGGTVHLKH